VIDRALTLNPNLATAWLISGSIRCTYDPELAVAHVERAARLNPLDPFEWYRCAVVGRAHFAAGRYEEASAWADKALRAVPNHLPMLRLKAATCGLLGKIDEGREWIRRMLAHDPSMTISNVRLYYGPLMQQPRLEMYLDGLRKAGLPE
jgi:tetratricopeptide (TPR) repeat protein